MRIQLNGEGKDVGDNISLATLVADLKLKPEQIAVEVNQTVVRRKEWEKTRLRVEDKVEIVHFVGGG
ncbi:MAG TPA: sulfur carrier protein ThiS [Pyrinomonadaceae bacterium]|nr:sulfur carrier protein ThiS [Pyrinomonadaceae bacterium]